MTKIWEKNEMRGQKFFFMLVIIFSFVYIFVREKFAFVNWTRVAVLYFIWVLF